MYLLVELRRCCLSSVPRSLAVEPMWSFHNETGEEVFLRSPSGKGLAHVAATGDGTSASLGELQPDPTCPLVAIFGVRVDGGMAWAEGPQRCAMGQTTRIEVLHGDRVFAALISVGWRRKAAGSKAGVGAGGASGGGVRVALFAAAYVRSGAECGLHMGLPGRVDSEVATMWLHLPAAPRREAPATLPWAWWPTREAPVLRDLGKASSGDGVPVSKARPLRLLLSLEEAGRGRANIALDLACEGQEASTVAGLAELLAPPARANLCSGSARDVCVERAEGPLASALFNVTYHVHAQGCLVLTVLRSLQPPLVCANYASPTVLMADAWRGAFAVEQAMKWRRVRPASTLEAPCPQLRSLEVFPPNAAANSPRDLAQEQPPAAAKDDVGDAGGLASKVGAGTQLEAVSVPPKDPKEIQMNLPHPVVHLIGSKTRQVRPTTRHHMRRTSRVCGSQECVPWARGLFGHSRL